MKNRKLLEGEELIVAKAALPPQTPPCWPRGRICIYLCFCEPRSIQKNKSDHKIKQNKRQQRQAGIYRILTCFCLFIKNGYDILEHIEYQVVVDNGFMNWRKGREWEGILNAVEENPIIAAVKSMDDLERCCKLEDIRVVFILFGDICSIGDIVKTIKAAGKIAMVHVDLIVD